MAYESGRNAEGLTSMFAEVDVSRHGGHANRLYDGLGDQPVESPNGDYQKGFPQWGPYIYHSFRRFLYRRFIMLSLTIIITMTIPRLMTGFVVL
jgi:hypothetical protein